MGSNKGKHRKSHNKKKPINRQHHISAFYLNFVYFIFFFFSVSFFFVCLQSLACLVFISFTEGIECVRKVVGKWKEKKEWTKSVIWQSKGQNKKKKKSFMPEWMNWEEKEEKENRNFLFFFLLQFQGQYKMSCVWHYVILHT